MNKITKLLIAFFMAIASIGIQQILSMDEIAFARDGASRYTTGSTKMLLARRERRHRRAVEETQQQAADSSGSYSGDSSASSADSSYGSSDSGNGSSDSSQSDSSVSSSSSATSEPAGEPHTLLYYVIQYVGILLGGTLLIALISSSSFLFLGLCWQIAKMMNGGKKPEIG